MSNLSIFLQGKQVEAGKWTKLTEKEAYLLYRVRQRSKAKSYWRKLNLYVPTSSLRVWKFNPSKLSWAKSAARYLKRTRSPPHKRKHKIDWNVCLKRNTELKKSSKLPSIIMTSGNKLVTMIESRGTRMTIWIIFQKMLKQGSANILKEEEKVLEWIISLKCPRKK